jgi:glycosyltransferase involved in cell wall biosynthesis
VRPIKLAVFLDQQLHAGGGYQQSLNAALLTKQLPSETCTTFFVTTVAGNVEMLRVHGIEASYLPLSTWQRAINRIRGLIQWPAVVRLIRRWLGEDAIERFFTSRGVDLIYLTSPSGLAQNLERLNYIFTVWDLCHRDDLEFPEIRDDRIFESRDALYNRTLKKAVAVLVDSAVGKKNLIHRYGIDEARVHVMPFAPASGTQLSEFEYEKDFIDIKSKYELNIDYVLYPAQFWPHKNHVYLLHGLKILEESYGIRIGAIFSGSDAGGNLAHVKMVTQDLGLTERIRFAGFVPNEEVPYLYRQAIALVMPTYFGPTNLPPLEAFSLGVPVLYSDKAGLRDQVGDAALLMDLHEPASMARHLSTLLTDKSLRNELIMNGKRLVGSLRDEDRIKTLFEIISDYRARRACWE